MILLSWIRIRIHQILWIRIRIQPMRIHITGYYKNVQLLQWLHGKQQKHQLFPDFEKHYGLALPFL